MNVVVIVTLAVPWVLVGFLTWVVYLLVKQHGRSLLVQEQVAARLTSLESMFGGQAQAQAPQGLEVGMPAPDFALPDLDDRERTLADFLGQPLLVTFFNTTCGYCREMAPRLGELPADAPRVLLVSHGDPEENRRLAKDHGWTCDVVLEEGWDVASAYQASGTPTGYLVDLEGRIASPLTVGADALFALLQPSVDGGSNGHDGELMADSLRRKARDATERARAAGVSVRDIGESRLQRDGLKTGTRAPDFTLRDINGKSHSLKDFRGTKVLLVFSDVSCEPCDELAPMLTELHGRNRGGNLSVVMISRGEPKANRAKAKQYQFEFPVLLQKGWEISKKYAMFGTPVGYLIDEDGVIAKDVALGTNAILDLVLSGWTPARP